ncbi:hypothetical protein BD560DRAFT_414823 [Blakeslea trispora]|nr:hypothetical protein BD560DRAFT_414823 [Blakeslea trispora]
MSLNSRYRERKYNTSENDRLLRALSQPVQAWDKTWAPLSTAKTLQTCKWTKSDRVIQFEPDEESEEEPESMELEQTTQSESTNKVELDKEVESEKTLPFLNENSVPGGPSTLSNKPLIALQKEEEEEQRSQTPKLSDISDDEQNKQNLEEEEDNDVDSINDASKHPALAPHAQARLTDDDFTDSTAAEPMAENVPSHTSHPLSQEIHQGYSAEQ